MRLDYLEAERVSRIGFLLVSSKNVNLIDLRQKLEDAIEEETMKRIKIEMYLERYYIKENGKSEYSKALGFSVDSRLVGETIRLIKAILNDKFRLSTGRSFNLVTKLQSDEHRTKLNSIMSNQSNNFRLERTTLVIKSFKLTDEVKLNSVKIMTIKQAMFALQDDYE